MIMKRRWSLEKCSKTVRMLLKGLHLYFLLPGQMLAMQAMLIHSTSLGELGGHHSAHARSTSVHNIRQSDLGGRVGAKKHDLELHVTAPFPDLLFVLRRPMMSLQVWRRHLMEKGCRVRPQRCGLLTTLEAESGVRKWRGYQAPELAPLAVTDNAAQWTTIVLILAPLPVCQHVSRPLSHSATSSARSHTSAPFTMTTTSADGPKDMGRGIFSATILLNELRRNLPPPFLQQIPYGIKIAYSVILRSESRPRPRLSVAGYAGCGFTTAI
ncbi:hypothetical protein BD413DRAFT_495245 [Trametes elegans]|nr:hypothetical protein BD413DRAFT_495245 [Trametes elegans]